MSYQRERDEFIAAATKEGLGLGAIYKLLRYASTLHRLTEAHPDYRTQELVTAVTALLINETFKVKTDTMPVTGFYPNQFKPIFQGDPRGAVLRLATPNYPYDESGKNGACGLYVPARVLQS